MKIQSISASAIKTFETCPRKFYTEYILKQRPESHPAALMGSSLHLMFENACNAVLKKQVIEVQDPKYWIGTAIKEFNVDPSYHSTLKQLTQNCIDWGYMNLESAQGFEISAEFKLPCNIEVHGYIDRLDIDRNWHANIIDLKTQKEMFTQEELKDNWQALIYFLATLNDNPLIQGDVKVSFWVLRHKIQEVLIPQSRFDELYNKLNDKTEEILKHDGDECIKSGLCQFCIADCVHKKQPWRDFSKQDMSKSVKDLKDFMQKLKDKKDVINKDLFD